MPILRPLSLEKSIPRFDFHLHTHFTDGVPSIVEYVNKAKELGITKIGFPEHCNQRSTWLEPFIDALNIARGVCDNKVEIMWGVEAKGINYQGELAAPDIYIEASEYIYGAFHSSLTSTKFPDLIEEEAIEMEYKVTLAMIKAKSCHAIAHPGALSDKYFSGFPNELFKDIAEAASQNDVALEINPGYSDDIFKQLETCQRYDCGVVLGSNAHTIDELGLILKVFDETK